MDAAVGFGGLHEVSLVRHRATRRRHCQRPPASPFGQPAVGYLTSDIYASLRSIPIHAASPRDVLANVTTRLDSGMQPHLFNFSKKVLVSIT
jgi:hypothetical protein